MAAKNTLQYQKVTKTNHSPEAIWVWSLYRLHALYTPHEQRQTWNLNFQYLIENSKHISTDRNKFSCSRSLWYCALIYIECIYIYIQVMTPCKWWYPWIHWTHKPFSKNPTSAQPVSQSACTTGSLSFLGERKHKHYSFLIWACFVASNVLEN